MIFIKKILLVDSDKDNLNAFKMVFRKAGYYVYTSNSGLNALSVALKERPEIILLEMTLPDMDGVSLCMDLRKNVNLDDSVIAFYTNRTEEYAQKAGYNAGADDYIFKSESESLLVCRVAALSRRLKKSASSEIQKTFGDIQILPDQYLIRKDGVKIDVPKKQFELLLLLSGNPGKIFSRCEILKIIWNKETGNLRTLDVHINMLRQKVGENKIETIRNVGYKFINRV
jgi:two-component system alkaline phosphatase synthesis response regulator PhoP